MSCPYHITSSCHMHIISVIVLRIIWTLSFLFACVCLVTLTRQWRQTRAMLGDHDMPSTTCATPRTPPHTRAYFPQLLHDIRTHPHLLINVSSVIIQTCFVALAICKWVSPTQQRVGYEVLPTLLYVGGLQFYIVCKCGCVHVACGMFDVVYVGLEDVMHDMTLHTAQRCDGVSCVTSMSSRVCMLASTVHIHCFLKVSLTFTRFMSTPTITSHTITRIQHIWLIIAICNAAGVNLIPVYMVWMDREQRVVATIVYCVLKVVSVCDTRACDAHPCTCVCDPCYSTA